MIVDTSAIMAILFQEQAAVSVANALAGATHPCMSAMSYYEGAIVADARPRFGGFDKYLRLVERARIDIVPLDRRQADVAREAYRRFGKGIHPARLNLADCCAYALAKSRNQPLLFFGDDFRLTDITPALPP